MSFYDRFELLELVRDDGIKTFQARDSVTGQTLLAHLFVRPKSPESVALLAKVDQLPAPERAQIVDRGEHEGTPYVVTGPLAGYAGFREWLVAKAAREHRSLDVAGAWKVMSEPPPPQPASHQSLDEQFANLFETAERPLPPPPREPVVQAAPPTPPPAPPTVEHTVQMPPGEFTRMFQAQTAAPPAAPKPEPPPAPGEFTRMFQTQPAPAAPAPAAPAAPPPPPKSEPGEFTRMFQTRPPAPTQPAPSAPKPNSAGDPGEFTRFFETPVAPGPLPQSPAVREPLKPQAPGNSGANRVGEFTRMFGVRDASAPLPPSAPAAPPPISMADPGGATQTFAAPQPSAPPAPRAAGPSEYTRMFSAPVELTLGQPSDQPQPAPGASSPAPVAAAAKTSYLPLILGLGAILILVVGVLLYFAFRGK